MKHLYFIRHGLSEMNVLDLRSGHTNTPLHPIGHEQATLAGKLARDQGIVFDIILASPLDRAHTTAKLVASGVEYPHENIILDDRLKERNFGELEGKVDSEEVTEGFKEGDHFIDRYEGVESLEAMQQRADDLLKHLHSLDHETVLVVSHGSFGRALYRSVNNLPAGATSERHNNAELKKFI